MPAPSLLRDVISHGAPISGARYVYSFRRSLAAPNSLVIGFDSQNPQMILAQLPFGFEETMGTYQVKILGASPEAFDIDFMN